jgi:crotonobetainyl-CoA:carnitine CoA-transferase CaiB-like acyl-CoA transferase
MAHDAFRALGMTQVVARANGASLRTTRCPIRVDGQRFASPHGAPKIGEHTNALRQEFLA